MSTTSTIIFFVLLSIAGGSMAYKIYLQTGIKNPEKDRIGLFKTFAFSLNTITYFLPMSVKYKDVAETKLRRKANKEESNSHHSAGVLFSEPSREVGSSFYLTSIRCR